MEKIPVQGRNIPLHGFFSFAFLIIINFAKVSVSVIMICCDMRINFLDFDATYHIEAASKYKWKDINKN